MSNGLPFNLTGNESGKSYKPEKYEILSREDEKNVLTALNEYKTGRYKAFKGKSKKELDEFMKEL